MGEGVLVTIAGLFMGLSVPVVISMSDILKNSPLIFDCVCRLFGPTGFVVIRVIVDATHF